MSGAKRTANFSKSEEEKLVQMVLQKRNIFENKKTDAVSSKQKNEAWEQLALQFNATAENQNRTGKVLRDKYQSIKRSLRKQKADARKELFLTGGGPLPSKISEPPNVVLDQLSEVMGVSVDGLPPRNDDDSIITDDTAVYIDKIEYLLDENIDDDDLKHDDIAVDCIEKDWIKYQPSMLRKKKSETLKIPKGQERKKNDTNEIIDFKIQILKEQLEHARLQHEQKMRHSSEEHAIKMKILETELKIKQTKIQ